MFDALTSERVYKSAMSPHDAKEIIVSERGKHFDPEVVDAFVECWELFLAKALEHQETVEPQKAAATAVLTS